jgi:excisionase family DNA binding protein
VSNPLVAALLAELDDDALRVLAERLVPYLPEPEQPAPGGWLSTSEAASHLGISVNALHKLTAARAIRFEQAKPGAKCWFRKSDLDAWRAGKTTS